MIPFLKVKINRENTKNMTIKEKKIDQLISSKYKTSSAGNYEEDQDWLQTWSKYLQIKNPQIPCIKNPQNSTMQKPNNPIRK